MTVQAEYKSRLIDQLLVVYSKGDIKRDWKDQRSRARLCNRVQNLCKQLFLKH